MIPKGTSLAVTSVIAVAGFVGNLYIILCLILPKNRDGMEKVTQTINMTTAVCSFWHTLNCILLVIWSFFITENRYLTIPIYKYIIYTFVSILLTKVGTTALLFILYWTRIVPVKSVALLKLKDRLPTAMPLAMAVCTVTSFSMSTNLLRMDLAFQNNSDGMPNEPYSRSVDTETLVVMAVTMSLLLVLPLFLMAFACLSMLLHLNRHAKRLQSDACDISSPHADKQSRVISMLTCQLLLYACYILTFSSVFVLETKSWSSAFRECESVPPSLYSLCTAVNMILRNAYLRKTTESFVSELKRRGQ